MRFWWWFQRWSCCCECISNLRFIRLSPLSSTELLLMVLPLSAAYSWNNGQFSPCPHWFLVDCSDAGAFGTLPMAWKDARRAGLSIGPILGNQRIPHPSLLLCQHCFLSSQPPPFPRRCCWYHCHLPFLRQHCQFTIGMGVGRHSVIFFFCVQMVFTMRSKWQESVVQNFKISMIPEFCPPSYCFPNQLTLRLTLTEGDMASRV